MDLNHIISDLGLIVIRLQFLKSIVAVVHRLEVLLISVFMVLQIVSLTLKSAVVELIHLSWHLFVLFIPQRHVEFSVVFGVEIHERVDTLLRSLSEPGHFEAFEMLFVVDICSHLPQTSLGL